MRTLATVVFAWSLFYLVPDTSHGAEVTRFNADSPHARPIALLPDESLVYVVNTPADTVDVIDTATRRIVARINVGIDPVGVAVRPDGREVWVTNHISDSVSVIDADPNSPTRHQVLATVQEFDAETRSTRFDEPVGIAFAGNDKAYVALSSSNRIAIVDVSARTVTGHLRISAQDPRAIAVRGDRLYVLPFESNNQTQLSGCNPENIDGHLCTFDAQKHVVNAPGGAAQSLSTGYVSDIVKHPRIPDRDLYVFDTSTDELLEVVNGVGTLLYGIAVDSAGRVFVAQTDARNDANGKAGTEGHGLAEMENRAFLNRITRVGCGTTPCDHRVFFDLEPLPPQHPTPGMALATPFGIQITADDATLVVTAAASGKLFTVDAETGDVLGRVTVDSGPRGVALQTAEGGSLDKAWVLNALANTVTLVDISDPTNPTVLDTIELEDPTEPDLKLGRIAFNDADASSTGTFSCASCHPNGHMDQLLWVLDTPLCDDGCDQIQPRLVQDIRGLRDTAPYHWDGTLGDPYGGINTANINTPIPPNSDPDVPESATLHVIDSTLATAMRDLSGDEKNDDGKAGRLDATMRAAMSKYLLSVPYPPAPERPYTNELSDLAKDGIEDFHHDSQCGNCHRLPFWVNTNMGGSGMDVPSWRGANDRWKTSPQNRFFFADLIGGDTQGFPEQQGFGVADNLWQMIVEGSTGFSGSFARQTTLNPKTARRKETTDLLAALEQSAAEGGIVLQGEGSLADGDGHYRPVFLEYDGRRYQQRGDANQAYSREELLDLADSGDLLVTLTGRLGGLADYAHPQPTIWSIQLPVRPKNPAGGRPMEFPELHVNAPMRMRGRHIHNGAHIVVDGRKVGGSVRAEEGTLPDAKEDVIIVELAALPASTGMHLLQIQNPEGLFSNDYPFFVLDAPRVARSENLISSGGSFDDQGAWMTGVNNASVTWDGEADFTIDASSDDPWKVQLSHAVSVTAGVEYVVCYSAKGEGSRYLTVNVDTGPGDYRSLMGTGVEATVGSSAVETGASLSTAYHHFRHRFISPETDAAARLRFDLAQSDLDVQIDNVGLYEGNGCGHSLALSDRPVGRID